jgi:hypothetical protein
LSTTESTYRSDPELRARIQAFSPDEPGVVFPFSARLARENGWTREHAGRVTREYLRFVYLAMTAGHPVTPSLPVDEAWHLHLTYTRSYWEEMCGRVLGRPLHHEPTRGGEAEEAKFSDWYARTLASYRTAFGEEPPADVWPRPAVEETVSLAASVPVRRKGRAPALFAAVLVVALFVGACTGAEALNLVFGGAVIVLLGMMFARVVTTEPGWLAQPDAGKAGKRRKAAGTADGADAGCGSDGGGGDTSHHGHDAGGGHGGCGGHSGCGGHGGCGHGGCGGGGCGSH